MTSEAARSYKYVEGLRNKPWHCRINVGHDYKRTGAVRMIDVEMPEPPYYKRVYEFHRKCSLCGKSGKPDIAWEKDANG
jgi:hypothetical protein